MAKIPPPKPSRANVPLQGMRDVKGQEFRIVLLGRTGAGKSATGNAIFGEKVFDSGVNAKSITAKCAMHKAVVQDDPLLIVDTPGLFDTQKRNEETKKEILKLLAVVSPGPHAIILVVPIHQRYTEEMKKSSEYFQEIFGIAAQAYTMVLFTGADNLEADGMTFEDYIAGAPPSLNRLLGEIHYRYVPFDNHSKSEEKRRSQIANLMTVIKNMVAANGGRCYSNDSFEGAEKALEGEDAKRVKQFEAEKKRKLDALRYPSETPPDLGTPDTVQHRKNFQKQQSEIKEEFAKKILNARQDVRQSIIFDEVPIYPDASNEKETGWFVNAVKKVASALGINVQN